MKGRLRAVGVALLGALVLAPGAAAQTDFTWTGASSGAWSDAANWSAGAAPSGTVGTLSFPPLSCETCYGSSNDVSAISADRLQVDDGSPYLITGDPITLGSSGITATTTSSTSTSGNPILALPLALAAPQTWSVSGGPGGAAAALYVEAPVSDPASDPLSVSLADDGNLGLSSDTEVGAFDVVGADPADTGNNAYANGSVELTGHLNATSGQPVSLTDSELDVFPPASGGAAPIVGALSSTGGSIYDVAELDVDGGVSLDPQTATTMFIYDQGLAAGTDYSQLNAASTVTLGGSLNLSTPAPATGPCPLHPGQVYPLITTTGTLSGSFDNAPQGTVLPLGCGSYAAQINYTADAVTATVVGASVSLAASSTTTVTNQPVTLTATVNAYPLTGGTVEFEDNGSAIPGCAAVAVTPSGSAYTATCQASFPAGASPLALTATYTPAASSVPGGATSASDDLTVGPDATTTTVSTSSPAAAAGSSLTYTATVAPAHSGAVSPSGTVEFLDGGSPITGCASRSVTAGAAYGLASCTVASTAAGSHAITAAYSGDANFSGSASAGAAVAAISATTESATKVSYTRALLNGIVNSGGTEVAWRFEFGRTVAHEQGTPIQTIRAGHTTTHVSWPLKGLSPGIGYHVRLVVSTVTLRQPVLGLGQDRTFKAAVSGQLRLTARNLLVTGDTVAVPQRCTSRQRCTGRLTITTRIRTGKRFRTLVCATSHYRLSAHRRQLVSSRLTGRCLALLGRAPHHRLGADYSTRPQTAQLPVNEAIGLIL